MKPKETIDIEFGFANGKVFISFEGQGSYNFDTIEKAHKFADGIRDGCNSLTKEEFEKHKSKWKKYTEQNLTDSSPKDPI